VEHTRERVVRLEQAIVEVVKKASPELQQVINDLQALRRIADISAVTIPTREYPTDQSSPFPPWLLLALSSAKPRQQQE
jgi:hypothetical protein